MQYKSILFILIAIFACSSMSYAQKPVEIWVHGACGQCEDRIETAALQLMGVEKAEWNFRTNILKLETSDGFYEPDVHTHIASVGHDTKEAKASDEVYNALPGCCQYRDLDENTVHNDKDDDPKGKTLYPHDDPSLDHDNDVHGVINEKTKEGNQLPIVGATVYWAGSTEGTTTDDEGYFTLIKVPTTEKLVVSYVGFPNDTIDMTDEHLVEVLMKNNFILDEVSITHRRKSTEISFVNTMKVQNIDSKELLKAACCSLSESFETTPSVDVSFTDAITGTRKIELLGLAGPYVQVMRENMPYIRGLSALYGFSFTPGPWIESMQLNMGAGSVVNGPESMTGQINVEVKKPNESERLFVNGYANQWRRFELNVNGSQKVNDQWNTAFLAHGSNQDYQNDQQDDGFMDAPISKTLIGMNRWKYTGKNGLHSQFGIKGTYLNKISGQLFDDDTNIENIWQADVETTRMEGWFKMGKVFTKDPTKTAGFQLSVSNHQQKADFGPKPYDADQTSVYSNLIYQQLLGSTTDHKLRLGASYQYDKFNEDVIGRTFDREESLAGVFSEYDFSGAEEWQFILGLRADYHNNFGLYITPRFHAKYSPNETTALRLVAGKGQRTATVFAENIGIFASNRNIILQGDNPDTPYGLEQEIAWNVGLNFTKEILVNQRSMIFSTDYYYTHFVNQIVIDFDQNPQEVYIYNLGGESYSHSVQAQVDYEVLKNVDLRLAYRFNDVQTDFLQGRLQKPLTSRHRAFVNIGWDLGKEWVWDGTLNFQGQKRIPSTATNPEIHQLDDTSPNFMTFNTQVSKSFKNGIEMYLGVENLFNFIQKRAIISADDPSSQFFDSSLIWGPIQGRNLYAGFRYRLF